VVSGLTGFSLSVGGFFNPRVFVINHKSFNDQSGSFENFFRFLVDYLALALEPKANG
jgi:hypothetical protein